MTNYSTLADVTRWNWEHNSTTEGLGNGAYFFNTKTGQDYFDAAVATTGLVTRRTGLLFAGAKLVPALPSTSACFTSRKMARLSSSTGKYFSNHLHRLANLKPRRRLLVPNVSGGGAAASCASVPTYAGYLAISIPEGQNGWQVPSGMCIYGRRWQ